MPWLVAATIITVWVRSEFVHDYWPAVVYQNEVVFQSVSGRLIVARVTVPNLPRVALRYDVEVQGTHLPDSRPFSDRVLQSSTAWNLCVHQLISLPAAQLSNAFGFSHAWSLSGTITKAGGGKLHGIDAYSIPYWACLIPPLLFLATLRLIRRHTRRRIATGLCPRCGYDLRATPTRCPECGTSASPSFA